MIVSSKVEINAFVSIIGIIIGGAIAGVSGMFLAIPVLAILKVIKRESGLPQILWVLSIIFIPPFLAMLYLFNAMIINKQIKLKS